VLFTWNQPRLMEYRS